MDEITSLYKFYHEKFWLYRKAYKRFKTLCYAILSSTFLIVAGTIAEGVIMNPIILGIIPGSGLILKTLK